MRNSVRPTQVVVFSGLLLLSALFMAFMGMSAAGFYVPAVCLLLQAVLLWRGRAVKFFEGVMLANQLSGVVLILCLWLGSGLGEGFANLKLDVAGVMLLINLLCGGPLMSLLSLGILSALRFGAALPAWFSARAV